MIYSERGILVSNCVISSPDIFLNLIISFREVKEERPYFIKRLPILCVLRSFNMLSFKYFTFKFTTRTLFLNKQQSNEIRWYYRIQNRRKKLYFFIIDISNGVRKNHRVSYFKGTLKFYVL